jgi:hypothetical protein
MRSQHLRYPARTRKSSRSMLALLFFAPFLCAQTTPTWVTTLQTGLADTFQMTLGGTFGNGPAWQNRITTGISNAWQRGDSLYIYGWDTLDARNHSNNWQAGVGYRFRLLRTRRHAITFASGLQHWDLPSVKTGTVDWLIPGTLTYETRIRSLPITVNADSWTLLKSSLPRGSLLHTQLWFHWNLVNRERLQVTFKHGPAHTYSWGFYGLDGNRVVRYQTLLCVSSGKTTLEGGYRKQWGLQHGIVQNNFWQFTLARSFSVPYGGRR